MDITLKNEFYTLVAGTLGGELKSVINNKCGGEFIWQGDKNVWINDARNLFPVCGRSWNKLIRIGNNEYPMDIHGFARSCEFMVKSRTEASLELMLESSESTKKYYPYDFEFYVNYKLAGNKICHEYRVINKSAADMFFSVGGHTPFILPGKTESGNDYNLSIEEGLNKYELRKDGFITGKVLPFQYGGNIKIHDGFFDSEESYALTGFKNKTVKLYGNGNYYVKLDFDGFDNLLLWQVPGKIHYIAIEPWSGLPDLPGGSDFTSRPGIVKLGRGKEIIKRQILECGEI